MIYLHIGRHKTGTTQVQQFIYQNRRQLADLDIAYPCFTPFQNAHHSIALSLLDSSNKSSPDKSDGAHGRARLQAQLDAVDCDFILSSEVFQNVEPYRVLDFIGDRDITIICYLREQTSYALSSYSQNIIGARYFDSFSNYAKRFAANLNYCESIAKWVQAFGVNRVQLRVYDRDMLIGGDIRQDFLNVLGIDKSGADFDFSNTIDTHSIYGDLLKIKIALNRLGYDEAKYRNRIVSQFRSLAKEFPEFSDKPRVSNEFLHDFRNYYREQNIQLFSDYKIENAQQFAEIDLSDRPGREYLDQSFDLLHIPAASRILSVLYTRDADLTQLIERTLLAAKIRIS